MIFFEGLSLVQILSKSLRLLWILLEFKNTNFFFYVEFLTIGLLNLDISSFEDCVDPDQMAQQCFLSHP